MTAHSLVKNASVDQVVASWLRDEWHYSFYDDLRSLDHERLVSYPDVWNAEENKKRYDLLYSSRHEILKHVPGETVWYELVITPDDIERLRLISTTWRRNLTGGTLAVADACRNFPECLARTRAEDAEKIQGIYSSLNDANSDTALIFVASDLEREWIVIEGNHRLVAIAAKMSQGVLASCKAYVGVFPEIEKPFSKGHS